MVFGLFNKKKKFLTHGLVAFVLATGIASGSTLSENQRSALVKEYKRVESHSDWKFKMQDHMMSMASSEEGDLKQTLDRFSRQPSRSTYGLMRKAFKNYKKQIVLDFEGEVHFAIKFAQTNGYELDGELNAKFENLKKVLNVSLSGMEKKIKESEFDLLGEQRKERFGSRVKGPEMGKHRSVTYRIDKSRLTASSLRNRSELKASSEQGAFCRDLYSNIDNIRVHLDSFSKVLLE